ncbi:helix-turn-helix domain-containing protein [Streptomyces noursei]|uniref:helix-turn-helix domain-containing protein n=1 Tax=Streptomyces noursei TaxID=1971 RepID=UPI0023B828A2|nr:helix-turn-helix transcriptional regulator [Streptomyces noursei]
MSVYAATALSSTQIGALIRGRRNARRPKMTQVQLAGKLGYSASWVCRLEAGELVPSWDTILRIAAILDIPPYELTTTTHPPERVPIRDTESPRRAAMVAATVAQGAMEDQGSQEDAVRRRGFLTGTIGVGAAMVTGAPAAATERTSVDPATSLESGLFRPPASQPHSLGQLGQALGRAREDFRRARYVTLGAELPVLLAAADATRESLTGHSKETANALAASAYSLAGELAIKQRSEIAWVAADRALAAARASGQSAPLGEATRMVSVAMRHAGRHRQAADLLLHTSQQLADDPTPQAQAVRAAMLLSGGYTAAHYGDRTTALAMVDEAEHIGRCVNHIQSFKEVTAHATRAQCDGFRLSIFNALGAPDEGVAVIRRISPHAFPTAERRARLHTDAARTWHQLGDYQRTFASLRAIEHEAPEEVRRPSVQALTTDLLYCPVSMPGLKEFAARTAPHS